MLRLTCGFLGFVTVMGACSPPQCPLPPLDPTAFLPCLGATIGPACCNAARPLASSPCIRVWLKSPMLSAFQAQIDKARVACGVPVLPDCAADVAAQCPAECGTPVMATPMMPVATMPVIPVMPPVMMAPMGMTCASYLTCGTCLGAAGCFWQGASCVLGCGISALACVRTMANCPAPTITMVPPILVNPPVPLPPVMLPPVCALNEEYVDCQSSSCFESRCRNGTAVTPGPMCTMDCRQGCRCKNGFSRFEKQCVADTQCATATPCLARKANETAACGKRIGCNIVQCNDDGAFSPKQCSGSTGYCWCVNKEGKEVNDTRKRGTVECAADTNSTKPPPCPCPMVVCGTAMKPTLVPGTENNCCGGTYECLPIQSNKTTTAPTPKAKAAKGGKKNMKNAKKNAKKGMP